MEVIQNEIGSYTISEKAFQDIADTLMNIPHTETIYRRGMSGFFANILAGRKYS